MKNKPIRSVYPSLRQRRLVFRALVQRQDELHAKHSPRDWPEAVRQSRQQIVDEFDIDLLQLHAIECEGVRDDWLETMGMEQPCTTSEPTALTAASEPST